MIKVRKVRPAEAFVLSQLAMRSKAYWGYDSEFMSACKQELSHTPEQLTNDQFIYTAAIKDEFIVGFYKLENIHNKDILLEALFVDPIVIGVGIGAILFNHAKTTAIDLGACSLSAVSDPNAKNFYLSMGAKIVGQEESESIPGRFLPIMRVTL